MTDKPWSQYPAAGIDCTCYAYSARECACDADWTDPELRYLHMEVDRLKRIIVIERDTANKLAKKLAYIGKVADNALNKLE